MAVTTGWPRRRAPVRDSFIRARVRADQGGRLGVRLLASIAAGLGLAGASAPFEQRWLLPLAVAIFTATTYRTRGRPALLVGYVFGVSYLLTLTAWMRAVGADAWLLVSLAVAGYYALLAYGVARVSRLRAWPLWTACVWVGIEAAASAGPFGGFPWGRLVWATADTPLALWLPWVGDSGVSFLAALVGATCFWLVLAARQRPGAAVTVSAALLAGVCLPLLIRPESLKPEWTEGLPLLRVAIVQGDVPGTGTDLIAHHRQVTRNHVTATVALGAEVSAGRQQRPGLVVWPENSTAVDPFADAPTNRGIGEAAAAIGAPVLVGAMVDGPTATTVQNQGIVWDPLRGPLGRYTKRHPVPFGEYIPFRRWIDGLQVGRLRLIPRDMVAGNSNAPLEVNGARVANVICFDVAFDDAVLPPIANGGQLITVQTSNAMFVNTSQIDQQFTISRLRAMETGRAVAVAATNGLSGVIGPDGAVIEQLKPRTRAVAAVNVALQNRPTPALFVDQWVQRGLGLVAIVAVALTHSKMSGRSWRLLKGVRRSSSSVARVRTGTGRRRWRQ